MALVVPKYGGSSVQDADRIKRVAERIVRTHKEGNDVVVVVSAMGDTTDELLDLAEQVSPAPPPREMDMLLTAGERISNALVAMAIAALGAKAISFTGSQAGMITTAKHGDARIVQVTPHRLRKALDEGNIVLVAGFQGVSQDSKDVTTLGRGGSDTTAVALAAALEADVCEIYTDVDGIFSADPRIVADAHLVADITYEEMLEMAASGAKVLHLRAVEYARRYQVPLRVRSSYNEKPGSLVAGSIEEIPVEDAIITGVAHDRSEAKITVVGVPDTPGWRPDLPHGRRCRDQHRHGLQNVSRAGEDRPTSPSRCRAPTPRAVAALRAGRVRSASGTCSRTARSARSRWSGPDAQPPGRHGDLLRGAVGGGDQHRDDEHLRDPHLGDLPRGAARRRRARSAAPSNWAGTSSPPCTRTGR